MPLDFQYDINTGNRFLDLVDHDEDPDVFIANQTTHPSEKPKKPTKETKSVTEKSTKKTPTSKAPEKAVSSIAAKTNQENTAEKPTNIEQKSEEWTVFRDNNNQPSRVESGRGGRRFPRRGGSAGGGRPPYEGGTRGGGYQRSQHFDQSDGQQMRKEQSGFEQNGDSWGNETGNDNQTFSYYRGRGRGRGRGGPRRGNFEGGRGSSRGRGRGRGGRGNFNNQPFEERPQEQQQPTQEITEWQGTFESSFQDSQAQAPKATGQELDAGVPTQDRPMEGDYSRRGRVHFRSRVFRSSRNFGSDRQTQNQAEIGEGDQDIYRQNRRQYDRRPRSNFSGIKSTENKDDEVAHNADIQTENPEETPASNDPASAAEETKTSAPSKDWAKQVEEAEKQMTLDEYKKKMESKKQAQQEKVPQFHLRTANEGVDLKDWQNFKHKYQKKNDEGEIEENEQEEGNDDEENESGGDLEEEHLSGKKKIITIPLHFKSFDHSRGPSEPRGGLRRGTGRFRDLPYRDDQRRPKSPNQQQVPFFEQAGEFQNEEQQTQEWRPYRGGPRQGSGRGGFRRSYGDSIRKPRGGYNRSIANPNTPDFANALDFPTLPKQ